MAVECTKLCIRSTVRQAYSCLWHYKFQHIMIAIFAVLPFCLAGFLGWLDPVFSTSPAMENMPSGFNMSFALLVLTTFIWAVPVIILWHRLYLLGPEHLIRKKVWPLITRSLKVMSHSLIFFGLGLVTAAAITWGILYLRANSDWAGMTGTITEMGPEEYLLYILGFIFVLAFLLLLAVRFSMAFSAMAIGKAIGFTLSWQMTRRNTFRMMAASFLAVFPQIILLGLFLWAGDYFLQVDLVTRRPPDPDMIYILVLAASPLLTLPLGILCSLTSSFYRHCGCAEYRNSP